MSSLMFLSVIKVITIKDIDVHVSVVVIVVVAIGGYGSLVGFCLDFAV